jgi:hypothetical protein
MGCVCLVDGLSDWRMDWLIDRLIGAAGTVSGMRMRMGLNCATRRSMADGVALVRGGQRGSTTTGIVRSIPSLRRPRRGQCDGRPTTTHTRRMQWLGSKEVLSVDRNG